eukprot:scaffold229567_cov30-Tisochrysis_lutea.AAC.2
MSTSPRVVLHEGLHKHLRKLWHRASLSSARNGVHVIQRRLGFRATEPPFSLSRYGRVGSKVRYTQEQSGNFCQAVAVATAAVAAAAEATGEEATAACRVCASMTVCGSVAGWRMR